LVSAFLVATVEPDEVVQLAYWISDINFNPDQEEAFAKYTEGTVKDILVAPVFQTWIEKQQDSPIQRETRNQSDGQVNWPSDRVLWCHGNRKHLYLYLLSVETEHSSAGAGKTVLV
jgi:hypothetical protein